MTDKQIIIIDGVDVSGCCWYTQGATGMICADWHISNDCSKNPNCYYKQLKRKEQECEELKEYIKHLHNLCGNETDNQYEYKQTLQEIKEIATCCIEGDVARIRMKQILNKISECEVSNG